MNIIDARKMNAEEIAALLKKKAFDETELSPGVQAACDQMWGEHLTAAQIVDRIVDYVRRVGDEALLYFTNTIDRADLTAETLRVTEREFDEARTLVDPKVVDSMTRAIMNVKKFHEEQMPKSWITNRAYGSILGQKITPLDSVGIYVPGGTAAYPSSVIMNAVPAKVAGVPRIVMAAPPGKDGKLNPYVLVTAEKIGITEIYKMGGAQAIAALAFGTATVPKVNKITGPGNIFVTLAKKAVYGHVDIDMLAGPSEILLITDSERIAKAVAAEVEVQLKELPREEIAAASLRTMGKIILAKNMETVVAMANLSAPEHLEVMTKAPFQLMPLLHNCGAMCGAMFLGTDSPEPLGDYFAGPNHVLPTGGTAKFYSVLNVETFMKKTSIIAYTNKALLEAACWKLRTILSLWRKRKACGLMPTQSGSVRKTIIIKSVCISC